jgi:hypothetical protein
MKHLNTFENFFNKLENSYNKNKMANIPLTFKQQGMPSFAYSYEGDLTKEMSEKIALLLNLVKDDSEHIPEDSPVFTMEGGFEDILLETGYGISFSDEHTEEVEHVLNTLGFILIK